MAEDVSALILAGGKATRLGGVDKSALLVDGESIFARQIRVLAPRVAEILVSAPRPVAGYRTVADPVPDAGPLAGIAAGLAATHTPWLLVIAGDMPHVTGEVLDLLLSARRTAAPEIRSDLGAEIRSDLGAKIRSDLGAEIRSDLGAEIRSDLGAEIRSDLGAEIRSDLGGAEPGVDAVGVRVGELFEPLLSVLRVATVRPVVEARLAAKRYAAQRLLTDGGLRVHWLGEAALRAVDPALRALTNVNRPEDL